MMPSTMVVLRWADSIVKTTSFGLAVRTRYEG